MEQLKLYVDRMSGPSRALIIFCKVNGIEFEEVTVQLNKRQHVLQQYRDINPMRRVPALVHGDFKLFESHAIFVYLASTFSGVPDHWYPSDARQRARIHSVIDWFLPTLGFGTYQYMVHTIFRPLAGNQPDPDAADRGRKLVIAGLEAIESVWLDDDGAFLLGNSLPSIADLSFACGVNQLEIVDGHYWDSILRSHKRILKWIDNTRRATAPHFDDIQSALLPLKEKVEKMRSKL